MRHVSQESILFLCELEQAHTQPLELPAQGFEVARPLDPDGARKRPAPEFADHPVQMADRPRQHQREYDGQDQRSRKQRCGLPEQIPLRARGRDLQGLELLIDALPASVRQLRRRFPQARKIADRLRDLGRATPTRAQQLPDRDALGAQGLELRIAARVGLQWTKLFERELELFVILAVDLEQLAIADDLVEAGAAFEGGNLLEQQLVVAGALDALYDECFALAGEPANLKCRIDDREQQRHGHEGHAEQHQPAQGSRL